MTRRNWTIQETRAAFALYLLLEPSQIDKRNSDIIALAKALDRTPSAAALKLWNIAANDANRVESGRVGMSHGSKLDREIWIEYDSKGDELVSESLDLLNQATAGPDKKLDSFRPIERNLELIPEGQERIAAVRQRVNQRYFRNSLLSAYHNKCCITGISIPRLLVASHIKPWHICNPKTERLATDNGLLLNAFHDRAFDQGLITIDQQYKIRVSHTVKHKQNPLDWLWSFDGAEIDLPSVKKPKKEFIEYHNDVIFLK